MAKVQNNLVVHGLSGMLGKQVVVRRQKNGGYVMAAAPKRYTQLSAAQMEHQDRFRQAILYAKSAQSSPEYKDLAKARGQSAYNVAVADFLHPPEIQRIDIAGYNGAPGQQIAITAVDDVKVKEVGVLIAADDGTLVEKGSAQLSPQNGSQWIYTTTATAPTASVKIVVDVADLAGQVTEETEHT